MPTHSAVHPSVPAWTCRRGLPFWEFHEVFCAWKSCKEQLHHEGKGFSAVPFSEEVDGGKGGGLGFAGLGGRRAGEMGDKNKQDAECDQMQKENKGKKVAGTKGVKRAQKIRSGAEGGAFPCCRFCENL